MSGPSQLHERQVDRLVSSGATRNGFMQAMEDLAFREGCSRKDWRHDMARLRLIPDAFLIDEKKAAVIVYEVEITSQLTEAKMAKYVNLFWLIDQYGWSLAIVRVAANGGAIAVDPFWYELEGIAA